MEQKDIEKVQAILRSDIKNSLKHGDIVQTIDLIDVFANSTVQINNILCDDEIEEIIDLISNQYIDINEDIQKGDDNIVVFYDQIGSTICLGEQYLRGLVANGYKVIYIYENKYRIDEGLLNDVKKLCNAYYFFKSNNVYQGDEYLGNIIRKIIIRENPSKIICHSPAAGALGMSVMSSIHGARKYRIVPGDHHFYIGRNCFDYFIEFRPFGWSTAIFERKIAPHKIYNLSYYPIVDDFCPFVGLPKETDDKIIFAVGGANYKFQGSNAISIIVERILLLCNHAVFVYLGQPNKDIIRLIRKHHWENRIFLLGYRRDFAAVIRNVDILVNSYPFSGGLICQTAAYYNKPILAFSEKAFFEEISVEHLLGNFTNSGKITFDSIDDVCQEAQRLVQDVSYRKEKGLMDNSMLQTKETFNQQLYSILQGESNTLSEELVAYIDRTQRIKWYISIQNDFLPSSLLPILRYFRFKSFCKFYFLFGDMVKHFKYSIAQIMASYTFVRKVFHHET